MWAKSPFTSEDQYKFVLSNNKLGQFFLRIYKEILSGYKIARLFL